VHPHWADFLAAGAIAFAATVNVIGVQLGALFVGLSTITKFGALAALVFFSFLLGGGRGASFSNFAATGATVEPGLYGLALISVLWAYDGFADLSFASGEVKDPQRNLPRAIIIGTLAIIAIYVSANLAYLYMNPIDKVQGSRLVAADTMSSLFGQAGAAFISVVVMISTFGSLMGSMLASPRIFFAMADDRLFFKPIAAVHPKFHTPYVAILLACVLGIAMVMTQTFEQLTDTFVLAIPAIFVAAAIYLVINALITDPVWTSITFGVVLAGLPVYYAVFRKRA
jgi:amino acid transporter